MTLTNAINRLQLWQAELSGFRSWKLFSGPNGLVIGLYEGDYKNSVEVSYAEMSTGTR